MFSRLSDLRGSLLSIAVAILTILSGCSTTRTSSQRDAIADKVTFDLSSLNSDGLQGPPDGLRSLHYEFCIPARQECVDQVTRLDTTLVVYKEAKGRIRCGADEYLCMGNTHQKHFAEVLTQLAQLPYVSRIEESFFEE